MVPSSSMWQAQFLKICIHILMQMVTLSPYSIRLLVIRIITRQSSKMKIHNEFIWHVETIQYYHGIKYTSPVEGW